MWALPHYIEQKTYRYFVMQMGFVQEYIIEAPPCKDALMLIRGEWQAIMNGFALKEGISQSGKSIWNISICIWQKCSFLFGTLSMNFPT